MKTGYVGLIAAAIALGGMVLGCSSTGKKSTKSSVGGIGGGEKSLRTAVDKDPFPRAQGLTAGSTSNMAGK